MCSVKRGMTFFSSFRIDKKIHPALYNGCNYESMLGLKLTRASKSATVLSSVIHLHMRDYTCNATIKIFLIIRIDLRRGVDLDYLIINVTFDKHDIYWLPLSLSNITCWNCSCTNIRDLNGNRGSCLVILPLTKQCYDISLCLWAVTWIPNTKYLAISYTIF